MDIMLCRDNTRQVHTLADYLPDGSVRVRKVDKMQPDENTYLRINDEAFHNGVIEVDVRAQLLPDAPEYARGFIGIVFRANEDDSEFESFYIRPTNGRGCADPIRKSHGCQYFSYPGYTFSYFREFGVDRYEGAVDTIELGQWSRLRAEIREDKGSFFVDGVKVLEVDGFKHGASARGAVGLYVDIGTDGFFRNLSIEREDETE